MLALRTANRVDNDPSGNRTSLAAANGDVPLMTISQAFSDLTIPNKDIYDNFAGCSRGQHYQRSSGKTSQRKVEHCLAPLSEEIVIVLRKDDRAKVLFKVHGNGDLAIVDGFEDEKMLMITSVNANEVGFAVLTFIPEVDEQLRRKGYMPTERDALFAAYTEVAHQRPDLASKKSRKRLREEVGNNKKLPVDSVTFNYKGEEYVLLVPLVHEVSLYNQMVVLEDRFRQAAPNYQAVTSSLIVEIEKLRFSLKATKTKLADKIIDETIEDVYRFFTKLIFKKELDPATFEPLPELSVEPGTIAERVQTFVGKTKKRSRTKSARPGKKAKCGASRVDGVDDARAVKQELIDELAQINQNPPSVDDLLDLF